MALVLYIHGDPLSASLFFVVSPRSYPASTFPLPNNLLSPPPFPPGVFGLPMPASNDILDLSGLAPMSNDILGRRGAALAPASSDILGLRGTAFAPAFAVAVAVGGRGKWKKSFSGTVGGFPLSSAPYDGGF